MNLKMSKKHEILEDLKRNYTSVGHPIAFSGIDTIYKYYKKTNQQTGHRTFSIDKIYIY